MILFYIAIPVAVIGVTCLIIGYVSNASHIRKIDSLEQIIDKEKRSWVGDFSWHLQKLFSAPCPTCSTKTILAEGIEEEVRSSTTLIEGQPDMYDYFLLITKSLTRYCPKCEKLLDQPDPMTEWKTQDITERRSFEGGEDFKIIKIHEDMDKVVYQYAENNFGEHDRWGYKPGGKLPVYEEQLKKLNGRLATDSRLLISGWVFTPISLVLFFLGFAF